MAVRKIEYRVSADGISPSVKQFAGVQGDHKATELIFNIDTALYESLTEQLSDGGKLIYRFDGYDGEGGFCRSDTRDLMATVTYSLEEWLTRFGGVVKVVLVISLLKNDLTEMELFSFPALLQLKNLPEGTENDGESHESMSALAQVAKDSAKMAVSSAEVAVDAKEKTQLARAALENGTVWVFDGGDAGGNVDLDGDGIPDANTSNIKFVVDGEMSDSSENAVKNKVIKGYIDSENMVKNRVIKEYIDNLMKQAKLDAHPVGSYYWSSNATNPEDLFGGEWEAVKDKFILAAGDSYTAGQTGGEAEHILTVDEMPSHSHNVVSSSDSLRLVLNQSGVGVGSYAYADRLGNGYYNAWITDVRGGDQAHNNMPPYEVAYCWKRIA